MAGLQMLLKELFIVIVFLSLNYQYRYTIIVDIVDNTIMSSNVSRIGYIIAIYQSFRMS